METVDTRKTRLVFDARVARKLCKKNLPIIDIKPLKTDKDKTVFIFNNTPEFQAAFDEIMTELKSKEETKEPVEMAD